MDITAEQLVEVLNLRAQTDPLVKEILRSATYEVALRLQIESQQAATETEGVTPPPAPDVGESTI